MADDKTKDPASPASTSFAHDQMVPAWELISALLGGTAAMRAKSKTYLPQHAEETDESYEARLARTTLNNMFEETLNSLAGKPFAEEVKINDDVPAKILPYLDNVDLMGNKLAVYMRDWFHTGLAKAFCHTLTDMPRIDPKADGSARTVADDARDEIRPYFVMLRPENVLQIDEEQIDGVPKVVHARILESYIEREGFAQVQKLQIKVLDRGSVAIWRPMKTNNASGEIKWVEVDQYTTAWDFIPLTTFYAGARQGTMQAKPPLLDLAYQNVAHWQSTSEQRHALMTARFPILCCEGGEDDEGNTITIGPNKVLYGGKYYYVESTGAALEAGRLDLEALEAQMANYGAEFLKDAPGDPTATAKAIDSAESNSSLADIVIRFEDAVAQALSHMARLANAATDSAAGLYVGGTVELVKAFAPDLADGSGLVAVTAARANKDISREALIQVLILRGLLPEDFNAKVDAQALDDEAQKALDQGMAMMNLDPAGTPAPKPSPVGTPSPKPSPSPKPPGKVPA